jgi:cation:H+ antiporter
MTIIFWIGLFVLALMVLVKGADWFLIGAEKLGLAGGLSKFVVGVVIVGLGTSLPELVSGIASIMQGAPEIVVANAIGSNIANILLVIGISAIVAKRLTTTKNLIDLELPLLAASTVLFIAAIWDKVINFPEAVILVLTYLIYLLYTIIEGKKEGKSEHIKRPKFTKKDFFFLIAGALGLIIGSKYLIQSVVSISEIMGIATGVIALAAVAVGTSLPELIVSVKAALKGQSEIALGNIFGSNAFNLLMVAGVPALFSRLPVDSATYTIGVPALIVVTILFIISGISKRMYMWEGAMYLMLYIFFISKLFNLF